MFKFASVWRASHGAPLVVIAALAAAIFSLPVQAVESSSSTVPALTTANPATVPATVDGFRSAKFGLDEAALRAAIASDFALGEDAIGVSSNDVERTRVLTIAVPDLLPGGGTAEVSYVLGYKSQALIQVGIAWTLSAENGVADATLVANGDVLRSHFLAAGYVSDTIRSGLVLDNGLLLFRGEDPDGRATILLLQGEFADTASGTPSLTPASLALLYSEKPNDPDVFKLDPGQF